MNEFQMDNQIEQLEKQANDLKAALRARDCPLCVELLRSDSLAKMLENARRSLAQVAKLRREPS